VVPEWPKGADCKSAGVSLRWFESIPRHHFFDLFAGVAQLVERHPSKVDVESSNLFARSISIMDLSLEMLSWLSGRVLPW
jgi:hypothetical protein